MKIILLGTGTSQGIPAIACKCNTCLSGNKRNFRTRTSALVSYENRNIVIDTATEFRLQMIWNSIDHLDAILFTHAHADHIHGLDDVRGFNIVQGNVIPCFGNHETMEILRRKYDYVFNKTQEGGGKPKITLERVESEFELFGRKIIPLQVKHGILDILGYRIGSFAYITDASSIPAETLKSLKNLDVLVINALRYVPHSTHFSVGQALRVIETVKPYKAYLTHIGHILEHDYVESLLPENVHLGYDGLVLEIED